MFNSLKLFLAGSWDELRSKIVWPTLDSAQQSGVIVFVSAIIMSIFVGFMDYIYKEGITSFYDLLS